MEQYGEKIISFGRKIKNKEFDVETATKLIECKNINWASKTTEQIGKLKSDFGTAKSLAIENNKIFEIHSKTKIPDSIKEWLKNNAIIFYEESI